MSSLRRNQLIHQTFKQHEGTGEGRAELVRYCHLIVDERLVAVLLLQHFTLQLQGFNVMCHIVEVYSCCLLLLKLDALDSDLSEFVEVCLRRLFLFLLGFRKKQTWIIYSRTWLRILQSLSFFVGGSLINFIDAGLLCRFINLCSHDLI